MLLDAEENLAALFEMEYCPVAADVLLNDGDRIVMDEINFTVMHTPDIRLVRQFF